jgi:heme/copper-type cytochrome/quinol oxidase subunit 2
MSQQISATQTPKQIRATNKRRLIWGIICLTAPTVLFVLTLLIYAIVNFIASSTSDTPANAETLVAVSSPAWVVVVNVVLYIFGAISVIAWIPGIVVGIVLLSSRHRL